MRRSHARILAVPALLLPVLLQVACSSGHGPTAPLTPATANVTGSWDAVLVDASGGSGSFVFELVQSGTEFSGSFRNATTGAVGEVAGSAAGASVQFVMRQSVPCTAQFSSTAR